MKEYTVHAYDKYNHEEIMWDMEAETDEKAIEKTKTEKREVEDIMFITNKTDNIIYSTELEI